MIKSIKYGAVSLSILFCCLTCERNVDLEPESSDIESEYIEDENDYQWDSLTATRINLKDDIVEIAGDGSVFESNQVKIQKGGTFWIKGNLNNGQIKVQATKQEKVKLILDNVIISCNNDAAISIEQSERTIIILKDGSQNTINDGFSYTTDENNAAIYSKSDLVFTGNGKLIVNANYNDAIASKDGLIIHSGEYVINAKDDGIRGKDYIIIQDGFFNITAGGDALKSDNETLGFGYIDITYGEFIIQAGGDGIHGINNLSVTDGVFDITCDGYASSSKGLKAGIQIQIEQGNFSLNTVDDAIHSDQDILVANGVFDISTKDDGFHAENILTIDYAEILIRESYEGLEAKTLTLIDGDITLTSSDDGLNTASGAGAAQGGPQPGGGDNNLAIKGGTIVVYANGDGIDINGSVEMSDGTLIIHGPTANNNGALDYDGTFVMDGGFLVAAGSSGMAQIPGTNSSQYAVLINFTSTYEAHTLFSLQDDSGNEIVTFSPEHRYQSIALSSPELAPGINYNIYIGGSSTGSVFAGLYEDGKYTAGNLYKTFTITGIITTIGNTGGPGGPGGPRGF